MHQSDTQKKLSELRRRLLKIDQDVQSAHEDAARLTAENEQLRHAAMFFIRIIRASGVQKGMVDALIAEAFQVSVDQVPAYLSVDSRSVPKN
jgi:hypothetical protein